jgi:4-carboxymuconolactone decarboxylase
MSRMTPAPGTDRIAALTALGNARPQLEVHVAAGLNVGLNREEIIEVIMQMAVYSGFPAAIDGLIAAQAVFDRHGEARKEQYRHDALPNDS